MSAGAVIQGVGMVAKGIGSYMQSMHQADVMDFNSRQGFIDATISRQNADAKAKALRKSGRQLTGSQRTSYAKSGLRLEGTPLEVMAESIENIELDAISTRQQGEFQARQQEVQAKYQEDMADHTRKTALFTAVLGAAGGAASMFG